MERLTRQSDSGCTWFIDRESNDVWLEPCEMNSHHNRLAISKLAEYEKLDEKGLLLRLPCKVGDTVYLVNRTRMFVYSGIVNGIALSSSEKDLCFSVYIGPDEEDVVATSDFGKTVFVTQDEADAVAKELVDRMVKG